MQEAKVSFTTAFVTLTYDTDHVPVTKNGFMSLCKKDLQKFFKRFRKLHPRCVGIRYFAVGEYGGKTFRPHYHLLLFNSDVKLVQKAWSLDGSVLGSVHCGSLCEASVGYTLKYISKVSKIPLHQNDDRVPEFSLMSKGLGSSYLSDNIRSWHQADLLNRVYCVIPGGKKVCLPRYYKDKLYSDSDKELLSEHFKLLSTNVDNKVSIRDRYEAYISHINRVSKQLSSKI